tara:strand:- start:3440 stop:3616 length:177 start_codon:yes stop_codon:yes gene_type:complete
VVGHPVVVVAVRHLVIQESRTPTIWDLASQKIPAWELGLGLFPKGAFMAATSLGTSLD